MEQYKMIDLNGKKIKVRWYICTKSSENNKLFTEGLLYPVTDSTILNPKCVKTCVHKVFTDTNHWFEFSDTCINGLSDNMNIFGGNILENSKIKDEIIGNKKGKMISYEELW